VCACTFFDAKMCHFCVFFARLSSVHHNS
jgi:hypothetical protein